MVFSNKYHKSVVPTFTYYSFYSHLQELQYAGSTEKEGNIDIRLKCPREYIVYKKKLRCFSVLRKLRVHVRGQQTKF